MGIVNKYSPKKLLKRILIQENDEVINLEQ